MGSSLKAVVTGAAGHLGSHLVPALADAGFRVTGLDVAAPPSPLPAGPTFVQASLSDVPALRAAIAGADLIVHCASIHPWKKYTDEQYLDRNVKGTWNLYAAAADLGVRRVALTSSIAAIGYSGIPTDAWPATEDRLFPLGDLYSLTKNMQETIARMFADKGQVQTVALRPPPFMPRPTLETGFALTGVFALVDDIVTAHVAAARVLSGLQHPPEPLAPFEAFFALNKLPYTRADVPLLGPNRNVKELARKYWPKAYEWLVQRGYQGVGLVALYDLSEIERLLGWRPRYNFEEWFEMNGQG